MDGAPEGLPAGGNAAMLTSISEDPVGARRRLGMAEVHHLR